jgi:hypothetical protein
MTATGTQPLTVSCPWHVFSPPVMSSKGGHQLVSTLVWIGTPPHTFLQCPETGWHHCPLQRGAHVAIKFKQATEHFFSPMPWTAMPHLASMGARGQELMATFGVLTIPALVLIDGNGAVVCFDGQHKITEDPAGLGIPTGPIDTSCLPQDPWHQPGRASKPSGTPPTFGWALQVAAAVYTGPPIGLLTITPSKPPTAMPTCSSPSPVLPQSNVDMWQWPPWRQASTQPPPDPNWDASMHQSVIRPGKGAITFALPSGQPQHDAVSLRRKAAIQALAKTSYILTLAQQALIAGKRMDTATHLPQPPSSVWLQSLACIPPEAVMCLASTSTHNAFVPRILANEVAIPSKVSRDP